VIDNTDKPLEDHNGHFNAREPFVDIIPLGGLGEIGLNSMAIACGNDIIVIDAGLMFPGSSQPGVDLVIPDFRFLYENQDKLRAIILTHGHEDHIGALPFLLKECPNIPVYGTRLTLALLGLKLQEYHIEEAKLIEIKAKEKLTIGPFKLEFIQVAHSILDGVGIAIETPNGVLVHTGDFKMDLSASEADRLDLFKFASLGEAGVLALMSDSTNSDTPGHSLSEKEVGDALTEYLKEATGRVILACFASSLARIREIARAATASNRKIVFDGRSMIANVRLAQEIGYLSLPVGLEISFPEVSEYRNKEILIVVTGSQGEPLSALARMASGEHRQVLVQPGDTIIFSARTIPGNETAINTLVNLFHQQGAKVLDPRYHTVHASGHGHIEELKLMLSLTRPHYLIPIHGEMRHLNRHGAIAMELGMPKERVLFLSNGDKVSFTQDKKIFFGPPIATGRHLVEGTRLGSPGDPVIKSRKRLSEFGLVIVTLVLENLTLEPIVPPKVSILGVQYANEEDLAKEAEDIASTTALEFARDLARQGRVQEPGGVPAELYEKIRLNVRGLFRHSINRKPLVYPQVILMDRDET
jgi:ribonuclease J